MTAAVPLIAGALLALAELGFSFGPGTDEPGARILPRLAWAAGAGLGGTVASALVLLAATAPVARSLGVTVAGTAAAVIVVAMLSRAWRR
jgi:hypothetical protein